MFLEIYHYNPNTPDTNCKSIFLIEKTFLREFLKINGAQNQLHLSYCSDILGYKFDPHTHDF